MSSGSYLILGKSSKVVLQGPSIVQFPIVKMQDCIDPSSDNSWIFLVDTMSEFTSFKLILISFNSPMPLTVPQMSTIKPIAPMVVFIHSLILGSIDFDIIISSGRKI